MRSLLVFVPRPAVITILKRLLETLMSINAPSVIWLVVAFWYNHHTSLRWNRGCIVQIEFKLQFLIDRYSACDRLGTIFLSAGTGYRRMIKNPILVLMVITIGLSEPGSRLEWKTVSSNFSFLCILQRGARVWSFFRLSWKCQRARGFVGSTPKKDRPILQIM